MSKKIGLAPKTNKEKREAARQKEQHEKAVYIGNLTNRVVEAMNEIFSNTEPLPNVQDITDVLALAPVFIFSKQVAQFDTRMKRRQMWMKACIWSLKSAIDTYADPLTKTEAAWNDIIEAEGGENGEAES